jgi:hypothetical protein
MKQQLPFGVEILIFLATAFAIDLLQPLSVLIVIMFLVSYIIRPSKLITRGSEHSSIEACIPTIS